MDTNFDRQRRDQEMKKTIFDDIEILIFRKFQYTRVKALNMAKPRHFILDNTTTRLVGTAGIEPATPAMST